MAGQGQRLGPASARGDQRHPRHLKIEAGGWRWKRPISRADPRFDNVATLVAEEVQEKGLSLRRDIDPMLPEYVRGDPPRLGQILINFVGNAVKFPPNRDTSRCGRVCWNRRRRASPSASRSKTPASGSRPRFRECIFNAFEQADASTTRRFGGSGLGLAISRHLAQPDGRRRRAPQRPGRGSTFSFTARLQQQPGRRRTRRGPCQQPRPRRSAALPLLPGFGSRS